MDAHVDARAALAALGTPSWGWQRFVRARGELDPSTARRSAVLMLFGPTAGDGARPVAPADTSVVLLRRAPTLRHHPGQIAFPGGGLEPGDAGPVAAAVREAVEETGVDPAGIEAFAPLPDVPLAVSENVVTPVPAWWRHPSPVWAVDAGETAEVFPAPVAALVDPENRRVVTRVRGRRTPPMPAFALGDHLVWGFTAILLSSLLDDLGWSVPWDDSRTVEPDV